MFVADSNVLFHYIFSKSWITILLKTCIPNKTGRDAQAVHPIHSSSLWHTVRRMPALMLF